MAENEESLDPFGILEGRTPTEDREQDDEEKKLLGALHEHFRAAVSFREPYAQEWDTAIEYLKGRQFRYRHRFTGEVVYTSGLMERDKSSLHNVLRPTHRSLVGKLGALIPGFRTTPATWDREEVLAARVADKFLEYFNERESMKTKWLELMNDIASFGNAVAQVIWDEDSGLEVAYCEMEDCGFTGAADMVGHSCPNCEAQLAEAKEKLMRADMMDAAAQEGPMPPIPEPEVQEPPILVSVMTGDIKVRRIDPRRVWFQPGAESLDDSDYAFIEVPCSVSRLRQKFPEMAEFIRDDPALDAGNLESFNNFESGLHNHMVGGGSDMQEDRTFYYEYHERPTSEYPDGRIIYFTDTLILREVESPYYKLFKRHPLFLLKWVSNPSELWGEGFISQAWHRQKEINTLETLTREWVELSTRVKWLIPFNSNISVEEFDAYSSQQILFNPGAGRPEPILPPPMNPEVFNRGQKLESDVLRQAGVTEPEAGIAAADPNGRFAALMEAENDQQIGPITTINNEEWRQLNKCLLILAREFYSPERQFVVAGDDTYGEAFAFGEMNLSEGWDLALELEDGFSRNRAVRFNEAVQLFQLGALGNPQDPQTLINMAKVARLTVPGVGPDMKNPDIANAREKLHQIEMGKPVDPFTPYDDPTIMAEEFLAWLKGKGRLAPPEVTANVQNMWMFFTQWSMMQQQMIAMGMPPAMVGMQMSEQGNQQAAQGAFGGSAPGQEMSAPGGTPNSLNSLPGQEGKNSAAAQQMVQSADQMAESAAGMGPGMHEN